MKAVLARIDARQKELKLNDTSLATLATGRKDTVRNWRRAVAAGDNPQPQMGKFEAVARALRVTPEWLRTGQGPPNAAAATGMAEAAITPLVQRAADKVDLRRLAINAAAAALYVLEVDAPAFSLLRGDTILVDHDRPPQAGDLAYASVIDVESGEAARQILRYAPPWLMDDRGDLVEADDHARVTLRGTVMAVLREL